MSEADAGPPHTEIIHVDEPVVACDGGPAATGTGGALGHPRVYLHIEHGFVLCPYCSRLYVMNEGAGHASGH
jgi:uncharacterized Zn-finger protein